MFDVFWFMKMELSKLTIDPAKLEGAVRSEATIPSTSKITKKVWPHVQYQIHPVDHCLPFYLPTGGRTGRFEAGIDG